MENKKEYILDTYEKLLLKKDEKNISIMDIAKEANIAKGGLYYYFKNKDELLDSLVTRYFKRIIDTLKNKCFENKNYTSIEKIKLLFKHYGENQKITNLDKALHEEKNAYIHEKSQKFLVDNLSEILNIIIVEGIKKGEFKCSYPKEISEIILSSLVFLLDPGIFKWNSKEYKIRLQTILKLFSLGIGIDESTFLDLV